MGLRSKLTSTLVGLLGATLFVGVALTGAAVLILRLEESLPADSTPYSNGLTSGRSDDGVLTVGTPAPDFTLPSVDGGAAVRLRDRIGRRPVVLVLGSFGCSYFCARLDEVRRLYTQFGDRAEFLFVYLDNNHLEPDSLRAVKPEPTLAADAPVNRLARIRAGLKQYDLRIPCLDDWEAKRVLQAYRAFPAKLVIIDERGLVAFDSGPVVQSGLDPEGAAAWLDSHAATH